MSNRYCRDDHRPRTSPQRDSSHRLTRSGERAILGRNHHAALPATNAPKIVHCAPTGTTVRGCPAMVHAHQAAAPSVKVHPACPHAPSNHAWVPVVRSSAGSSATRAMASPVRLGVTIANVAPTNTSRRLVVHCLWPRAVSTCHLVVSNPMLSGSPAASTTSSHGRFGCHNASSAAASDQIA